MLSCLFVGESKLNHPGIGVGPSEESDPDRKIVRSKSRRHHDRRYELQEGVDVRGAFLIDVRRIDSVSD